MSMTRHGYVGKIGFAFAVALALGACSEAEDVTPVELGPTADAQLTGLRRGCGTADLSDADREAVEARLAPLLAAGVRPVAGGAEAIATIPTFVHVIQQGTGAANGEVSQSQIQAQIDVLNNAYAGNTGGAGTNFRFSLAGVTRTINSSC